MFSMPIFWLSLKPFAFVRRKNTCSKMLSLYHVQFTFVDAPVLICKAKLYQSFNRNHSMFLNPATRVQQSINYWHLVAESETCRILKMYLTSSK